MHFVKHPPLHPSQITSPAGHKPPRPIEGIKRNGVFLYGAVCIGIALITSAIICSAAMVVPAIKTAPGVTNNWTANGILPGCKALSAEYISEHQLEAGYCSRIMWTLVRRSADITKQCFLVPERMTTAQGAQIIVRYIEARPQRMHESFVSLAIEAFHDAWPCRS